MLTLNNEAASVAKLLTLILEGGLTPVFDLDGVWLDARHRQAVMSDGSLNLPAYIAASTYENCMLDAQLPLAAIAGALDELNIGYHCLTARPICDGTRDKVLRHIGAKPLSMMGRSGRTDHRRDYQLKHDWLSSAFSEQELSRMIMIDDNIANCEIALTLGMQAVNIPFQGH